MDISELGWYLGNWNTLKTKTQRQQLFETDLSILAILQSGWVRKTTPNITLSCTGILLSRKLGPEAVFYLEYDIMRSGHEENTCFPLWEPTLKFCIFFYYCFIIHMCIQGLGHSVSFWELYICMYIWHVWHIWIQMLPKWVLFTYWFIVMDCKIS
jgi:hypothetical protein